MNCLQPPEKEDAIIGCDDVEEDSVRRDFARLTNTDTEDCGAPQSERTTTTTTTTTSNEIHITHEDHHDDNLVEEAEDIVDSSTNFNNETGNNNDDDVVVVTLAATDDESDDGTTTLGNINSGSIPKSVILNLTTFLYPQQEQHGGIHDAGVDTSLNFTLASHNNSTKSDHHHNNNEEKRKFLGLFSGSAILVNYISVGYVLLPYGFAQGGIILSTIVLLFVVFQSYVTSIFILESCARANLVHWRYTMAQQQPSSTLSFPFSINSNQSHISILRRVQNQTVELSELCRVFLGTKLRNFFTVTTAFDLYCITWTFAAVFASSLANALPIMGNDDDDDRDDGETSSSPSSLSSFTDYKLYILIFAAITIPLSCMTILDQLMLQMIFLTARTLMLCLMIGTLIDAYIHNDVPMFGDQAGPAADVPMADFSNIVTIFQICIFSTAYQFAVPGIADQYENKISSPKKVLRTGVSYTFVTNLILAILASIFFGRYNTAESNNLNWLNYHGNTWDNMEEEMEESRSGWSSFVSSYIVLFVAIDGLAVFPLIALSLGDILLSAFYGENAKKQSWKIQILFRLAGSVPQLVGAMFISDLSDITKVAGVFTLLSYTTCPALLYLKSRVIMPRLTFYIPKSSRMKMWFMAWFLVLFSIALIIGVIVDTILRTSS